MLRWFLAALVITSALFSSAQNPDRIAGRNFRSDFPERNAASCDECLPEPTQAQSIREAGSRMSLLARDPALCNEDDERRSEPEQYIWFSSPSPNSSQPRYFRKSFSLTALPSVATLYFMGPYNWDITVNGQDVSHAALGGPGLTYDRPLVAVDISSTLLVGENTVTITASGSEVLAFKIVPAAEGLDAPAIVVADGSWDGSLNGTTWGPVESMGSIESDPGRFKGNFDLNMYRWPGYRGITRLLSCVGIHPVSVTRQAPDTVLLDFGREMFGRLVVQPSTQGTIHLQLNYGESSAEAHPSLSFLSSRDLVVPQEAPSAHGPLTGFRYVQVRFLDAPVDTGHLSAEQFIRSVPVVYQYQSLDPELESIWQISAYTAQLGLQTEFFDGSKRDRNPFAGDLYVTARAARAAFGHATDSMVKDTLADLLPRVCGSRAIPETGRDINCIPGYNAWWILSLSDFYGYTQDRQYLESQHENLVEILGIMKNELAGGLFKNTGNAFIFADWAPGMYQYQGQNAPEAIKITTMVYYMGFHEAAFLLREMDDEFGSRWAAQMADQISTAVLSAYFDPATGTFGDRVQTNAMAIFSGIAPSTTYGTIFAKVLDTPPQAGTPYFHYFVLEALEKSGHHAEAIQFMKDVWGGMLETGATSAWEVWDPACVRSPQMHACLVEYQNSLLPFPPVSRLYISLAHGWSAGPAAFLAEH